MKLFLIVLFGIIGLKSNAQIQDTIILRDEVKVTADTIGGKLKCEPSVVMHDSVVIVSWNDSYGGQSGTGYGICIAWSISHDLGQTFEFGGFLSENKKGVFGGADSWLSKDSKGNFYLQVLSYKEGIHLYCMANDNLGNWIRLSNPVNSPTTDKPFLHIQENDVFWISYTDNQEIFVISSKDHGHTWSTPLLVSGSKNTSRGGSSITTYKEKVFVSWVEGTADELWYTIIHQDSTDPPQLLYENSDLKGILTPGYSMGFDHEGTSGQVRTPNFTWLNSIKNDLYPVNLTFGTKEDDMSSILFFEYSHGSNSWKKSGKAGKVSSSFSRIFASNSHLGKYPAILYYDRRECKDNDCTLTEVYLSILIEEEWNDFKMNEEISDWKTVPGDPNYAPVQRNFGDYITLASGEDRVIAVWTDGRNGKNEIYSRIIELRSTTPNKSH